MDDDSENTCDLCKISYSSETELREHFWSLMHHIKIEQRKKGSVHNCTLCYATCENIIAFGKHLNEERHKKALEDSRRTGDDSDDELEVENVYEKESSQEKKDEEYPEDLNIEREKTNSQDYNLEEGSYEQPRRYGPGNSNYHPYGYRHPQKTYQDTSCNDPYQRDYSNSYNWYGDNSYYRQQRNQNYDTSHWNNNNTQWYQDDYDSGNYDSQWWGNYEMPRQHNQSWSRRKHSKLSWQHGDRSNSSWECNPGGGSTWDAEGHSGSWQQYHQGDSNYWSQELNPNEWYQDTSAYSSRGHNANLITCGTDGERQKKEEKSLNSSWKDDHKMDTNESHSKKVRGRIQKRGNNQKERSRERLSQSVDSASGKRRRNQNWEESFSKSLKGNRTDSGLGSSTNSTKQVTKGANKPLIVKTVTPRHKHRSGDRSFSGEPDSTTGSFVTDTVISSFSASLPSDFNSQAKLKNFGTELDQVDKSDVPVSKSLLSKGLKKTKTTKKAPTKVSPRIMKMSMKKSDNFDKGASILQKAEKLCKELREKRQTAKSEKDKKGKQEKQKTINQHIKTLSEINKSYVTGHLTAAQENMGFPGETASISEIQSPISDSTGLDKSSRNEIERIRQEIETSVQEQRNISQSNSQASETMIKKRVEILKNKPLNRETLLKLINSPRSRKERLKLSEMLSKYSKSQNKLSMPRFNLKMSGLYDTEEMSLEEIDYDDLSVDLQLEIAEMFEHDVPHEMNDSSMSPQNKPIKMELPDVIDDMPLSDVEKQNEEIDSIQKEIKVEDTACHTSTEHLEPVLGLSPALKLSDLTVEKDTHEIVGRVLQRKDSPLRITSSPKPKEQADVLLASPSGKRTPDIGMGRESIKENITSRVSVSTEVELGIPDMKKAGSNVSAVVSASGNEMQSENEPVETTEDTVEIVEVTSSDLGRHPGSEAEIHTSSVSELVTSTDTEIVCLSDKIVVKDSPEKSQTDSVKSIFEHIYTISLREEQVRHQIASLEVDIEQFKKVIEDATVELGKCGQKRKKLLAEEESLRSERLKVLEDAHSSKLGSLSDSSVTRVSSVSSSATLSSFRTSRNEKDRQNYSSSKSSVINLHESSNNENTLKVEPIDFILEDEVTSKHDDNTVISSVAPFVGSPSQSSSNYIPTFENERTLQDKPEKDLTMDRDWKKECVSPEQLSVSDVNDDQSKKTADLEAAGFVTLSSLMGSHNFCSPQKAALSPTMESDSERVTPVKQKLDELRRGTDSDDMNSCGEQDRSNRSYSMEFMGSIPGIDSASFLKQFTTTVPSSKGVTYMLMDKQVSGNTLERLQTVLKDRARGRTDSSELAGSSPNEFASFDIDMKPDIEKLMDETSCHYDSVASNCSLGEKIKKYCSEQTPEQDRSLDNSTILHPEDKQTEGENEVNSKNLSLKNSVVFEELQVSRDCTPEKDLPSIGEDYIVENNIAREEDTILSKSPEIHLRPPSPNKKKLRTKKERDRNSVRKQKEEFILPSSSDGNSDDDMPLQAVKQKLTLQHAREINEYSEESDLPRLTAPKLKQTRKKRDNELIEIVEQTELPLEEDGKTTLLEGVHLDTGSQTGSESEASQDSIKDNPLSDRSKLKTGVDSSQCVETNVNLSEPVQFVGPSAPVIDLQVFCDKLYVCYQSNQIYKFNLVTGKCMMEYNCHGISVNCLLITSLESPRVRMFAGGASRTLLVFNTQKTEMVKKEEMDDKIQCLHQNWGKLYIGLGSGDIVAWNLNQEKRLTEFQCSDRPISCITSATEGTRKLLLAGSQDFLIYICDANTGLLFRLLKGHSKTPYCIQVDGHTVYSASGDKTVVVSDLLTGEEKYKYKDHRGIVTGLLLHGNMVLTSSYDKLIRCFDKENHSILKMYYGAGKGVITRMSLWNNKIISGNREGLAEAVSLKVDHNWSCQYKNCKLVFGYDSHLLHHIMTDHILVNCRTYRCQWKGCNQWISSDQGKQNIKEHLKGHIADVTS